MNDVVLRVSGLRKSYGDNEVVRGLDFAIRRGECFGLLGPNGAGKSTFMKLMTGQLKPSKGRITMLGEPIWGNPPIFFRVGFCPEQDAFYDRMTGLEWLTALIRLNGYGETDATAAARAARGASTVQSREAASFQGIVIANPPTGRATASRQDSPTGRSSAATSASDPTSRGTKTFGRPSVRYAAVCTLGESEFRTCDPTTA